MPKAVSAHSTRRRVLATAAALVLAAPPPIATAFAQRPDPALALVTAYHQGAEAYETAPLPDTNEEQDRLVDDTFGPAWQRMTEDFPTPTTPEGAAAALRLLVDGAEAFAVEPLEFQVARAVLRWIEGGAA